jgi:DNA-binding response OmpR family regulator
MNSPTILYEDQFFIETIVLAEDNKGDRDAFKNALEYVAPEKKLISVTNGEDLLNLLDSYIPDLLFVDLDMPHKSGIQCIKEIRDNKSYDHLPIIIYSASSRINNIQVGYGLGANLFFIKPKEFSDLVASVKEILRFDWRYPDNIAESHFTNNHYKAFLQSTA